jgi:hypothetical protein
MIDLLLLNEQGAATLLGVSPRAVAAMVRKGKIPFVELPTGQVAFDPADLRVWVKSLKRPSDRLIAGPIVNAVQLPVGGQ